MTDVTEKGIFSEFFEFSQRDVDPPDDPVHGTVYALDTNILLNLYKFSHNASKEVLGALEEMRDCLFVPHHALKEFWPLRDKVRSGAHHKEASGLIDTAIEDVDRTVAHWLKRSGLTADDSDETSKQALAALDELKAQASMLTSIIDDFQKSTQDDEEWILKRLETILEGRVGAAPTEERLAQLTATFEQRVADGLPPGLRDVEIKKGKTEKAIGDFLIWRECLDHVKALSAQRGCPVDLTLVTEDHKDDWVRNKAETGNMQLLAARSLVRECRDETGGVFRVVSYRQLLDISQRHFGASLQDSTKVQVESPPPPDKAVWTLDGARDYVGYVSDFGNVDQLRALFVAYKMLMDEGVPMAMWEAMAAADRTEMRGFGIPFTNALKHIDLGGGDFSPMLYREYSSEYDGFVYALQNDADKVLGSIIAENPEYKESLDYGWSLLEKARAERS